MSQFVIDWMSRNPVMVGRDYPAHLALLDSVRRGVHHVLVIEAASQPIGIALIEDLRKALPDKTVGCVMRASSATVDEQATVEQAEALMDEQETECLPVVSWDGLLHGVITLGDIARARAEYGTECCASCGTSDDLETEAGIDVAFCRECLAQVMPPSKPGDDLYFTLGGG